MLFQAMLTIFGITAAFVIAIGLGAFGFFLILGILVTVWENLKSPAIILKKIARILAEPMESFVYRTTKLDSRKFTNAFCQKFGVKKVFLTPIPKSFIFGKVVFLNRRKFQKGLKAV